MSPQAAAFGVAAFVLLVDAMQTGSLMLASVGLLFAVSFLGTSVRFRYRA